MRQAHEGGEMRQLAILLLLVNAAFAAVDGVVVNGTTGQPQAGAKVTLYKFGTGAMEPVADVQTDAQGKFAFTQEVPAQGPSIVRATWQGVLYNRMIPPGTPATGLTVTVYNVSKEPGAAKVSKHMLLFEPAGGKLGVTESWIVINEGKTTWFDPASGTVRFYLPAAAESAVLHATSPDGGVPVPAPVAKVSADVRAARFEIKPGETRLDLTYQTPYTSGEPYQGKIASKDDNTYLIAPNGVTLAGENLTDLGPEPRTQAHIYGLQGNAYKITLTGTAAPSADAAPAAGEENAGPQIEQILPRVNNQKNLILGLALGILALGFLLLYRKKETDERGRR
jgi:hypothetical protein